FVEGETASASHWVGLARHKVNNLRHKDWVCRYAPFPSRSPQLAGTNRRRSEDGLGLHRPYLWAKKRWRQPCSWRSLEEETWVANSYLLLGSYNLSHLPRRQIGN